MAGWNAQALSNAGVTSQVSLVQENAAKGILVSVVRKVTCPSETVAAAVMLFSCNMC